MRSSGFKSVGKFGIGFYSIFMIAASAEVLTRVYDKGTDTALLLKFPTGLTLTPIKQNVNSRSTLISTRVKFKVDASKQKWEGNYTINRNVEGEASITTSFENVLKALCAGLDTDVYYHENEQVPRRIHQNIYAEDFDKRQWLRDISYADAQANPNLDKQIEETYKRLEYITKDGYIYGLAAINTTPSFKQDFLSITTVGGLAAQGQIGSRGSEHYIGYMDSTPAAANRKAISPMKMYGELIKQWAQRQYDQVKSNFTPENKLYIPYTISTFHVDTSDICLLLIFTQTRRIEYVPVKECIRRMVQESARLVFLLSSYSRGHERHIDAYTRLSDIFLLLTPDDILIMPIKNSSILTISEKGELSLYSFIKRQAEINGVELEESVEENFSRSMIGIVDALYIKAKI